MTGKRELSSFLGFQLSLMKLVDVTGLTVAPDTDGTRLKTEQMEELVKRALNPRQRTIQ